MTFSKAPVHFSSIEDLDLFGFNDYCLADEIQAEIFDSLLDSMRTDHYSDDCHPNDLKDFARTRLNYPIREPYEHQYLRWVSGISSIH